MFSLQFWKHYIKTHTVLVKVLLSYLLISVLFITTFSFIALETFSSSSKQKVNSTSNNMIHQSYNTANILLSSLYRNFYQLYQGEPILLRFINQNSFDSQNLFELDNLMQNEIVLNPILDSVYLYNLQENKVFSSETGVSTIEAFEDKVTSTILTEPQKYDGQLFIPIKTRYKTIGKSKDKDIISVPYYTKDDHNQIKSAMIVNIDQNKLKKMIPSELSHSLSNLFILNSNGDIVTNLGTKPNNPELNKEIIDDIFTSTTAKNTFIKKLDGSEYFISYIKANGLGWTFVGVGDYQSLLGDFYIVQKIIIGVTGLFILFGIILAIVASKKIYSPLYELLEDIEYGQPTDKHVNEYDYLRGTFKKLKSSVDVLKADNTRLSHIEITQGVLQLLNGDLSFSPDKNPALMKKGNPLYLVLAANLPTPLIPGMLEVVNQTIRFKFPCESVVSENHSLATIIFLPPASSVEEVSSILEPLHQNFKSLFQVDVTIGVGDIVDHYESVHISYAHAKEALKYKLVLHHEPYILYEKIQQRSKHRIDYPYEKEKQILSTFKHKQENKLPNVIDEYFTVLTDLNINDIEMFITQLMMAIVKEFHEVETGEDQYEFQLIYDQVKRLETLEDIKNYVHSLLLKVINTIKTNSFERKKLLVDKLIGVLDHNYSDPNVSIINLAESVDLSQNYIRTLFKEVEQKSINEYLMEIRIEKAKELLIHSDFTAKEISEKVGFSDNRYFYVVFKKYTGQTTEHFRREYMMGG
jgi:two-component system, response regulator YesN